MPAKHGLGRGLESLIPSVDTDNDAANQEEKTIPVRASRASHKKQEILTDDSTSKEPYQFIPVDLVVSNPYQPRKVFAPADLEELSSSIRIHGVLEPIVVTRTNEGYELIAGERRLQATKLAGLKTIPAHIRTASAKEKLELSIIENVQRSDLNAIEKAKAFKQFIEEFHVTHDEIAQRISKSRVYITNTMHLLDLPLEIQRAIIDEVISEGHGRAILMIKSQEKQREAFNIVKSKKMSVRQTEDLARQLNEEIGVGKSTATRQQDADIVERQKVLQDLFGTKVQIMPKAKGGRIVIEYFSREDLDLLAERLTDALS